MTEQDIAKRLDYLNFHSHDCRGCVECLPQYAVRQVFLPEYDGVDHINIYSKGATPLGRWLTNFSVSPFNHPRCGHFNSMEGFWYFVKTGYQYDELRTLAGWSAKQFGKGKPKVDVPDFEDRIREGIRAKLLCNPLMLQELVDSTLPLTHYYVFGGMAKPAGYEWITEYIDSVRKKCQDSGYEPLRRKL